MCFYFNSRMYQTKNNLIYSTIFHRNSAQALITLKSDLTLRYFEMGVTLKTQMNAIP